MDSTMTFGPGPSGVCSEDGKTKVQVVVLENVNHNAIVDAASAAAMAAAASATATSQIVDFDLVDPAALLGATSTVLAEGGALQYAPTTIGIASTESTPTNVTKKEESIEMFASPVLTGEHSFAAMSPPLPSASDIVATDILQDLILPDVITDAVAAATTAVDVGASAAAIAAATAAAVAALATAADHNTSELIAQATAAAFEAVSTDDSGAALAIDAATLAAVAAVDQAAADEAIAAAASLSINTDSSSPVDGNTAISSVSHLERLINNNKNNKRQLQENKENRRKRGRGQHVPDKKSASTADQHPPSVGLEPTFDSSFEYPAPGSEMGDSISMTESTSTNITGESRHGEQLSSRRMKDRERYAKMTPEQRQLYNAKRREQYHRQTDTSRQKRRERERNRYHALPQDMTMERNSRRAKLERDRYQKLSPEQLALKNKARRERAALARQKKGVSPSDRIQTNSRSLQPNTSSPNDGVPSVSSDSSCDAKHATEEKGVSSDVNNNPIICTLAGDVATASINV